MLVKNSELKQLVEKYDQYRTKNKNEVSILKKTLMSTQAEIKVLVTENENMKKKVNENIEKMKQMFS